MEFHVLGPLEALDGGRPVPLRGEKQRALLAALLIRANEVVPEDVLLHELWGGTPPGSGKAALRVRVSQLFVENIRAYQAAPTGLRVTQAYLESVRSRQDAPTPPPGGAGAQRPLLQVSI